MKAPVLGFIGFGEAAHSIARGLRTAGAEQVLAYDVNAMDERLGARIRERAVETGVRLVDSVADLARESDVIFSAVVASVAEKVAAAAARSLEARHFYVDLNSASPAVKQAIHRIVYPTGAKFVEAAVMAPVPPHGHRVPMLLGGLDAPALVELLAPYGMQFETLSDSIGTASAVKMFRSLLIKGLEALILECLIGASRYDAEARVFASMSESFPGIDWNHLAHYLVGRTALHGERRAHEMEEVADTLRTMGIEPIMAAAAARRLAWCAQFQLGERFSTAPSDYREVMRAISEATRA